MNAPTPINPISRRDVGDGNTTVTLTIPLAKLDKLYAWINGDTWEKAQAVRDADLSHAGGSVVAMLKLAHRAPDTSGGLAVARLLAALWNSYDYTFTLSDLRVLDEANLEHALRVLRAYAEINRNPSSLIVDGDRHLAAMVKRCGLLPKGEG